MKICQVSWYDIPGLLHSLFLPPKAAEKRERASGAQPPNPQSKGLRPFANPLTYRSFFGGREEGKSFGGTASEPSV